MKKILFILFGAAAMISCKSNSTIITSKSEAKKKGIYSSKIESTVGKSEVVNISRNNSTNSKNNFRNKPSDVLNKDTENNSNKVDFSRDIINEAKNYLGVRYRTGGTTKAGMDCSGLVTTVFNEFDYSLPRTSRDMATVGEKLNKTEITPGDLVFFKTNGRSVINHVGIVVDVDGDEFKFIHSSTSKGVIISSNQEAYYKRSFVQANRVL
nr:C40 family peptidase [uncultured Flavobacterium sp.]